jgi:hypothetical protein
MMALLLFTVFACSPAAEPDYARTSGPMGVANDPPESGDSGDTGENDTGGNDDTAAAAFSR